MGAWARPGCAEIGSEREERTGFLADDPLASVLDAASENSLTYSSSRPLLLEGEMYMADPVRLTSALAALPGRQCHCR